MTLESFKNKLLDIPTTAKFVWRHPMSARHRARAFVDILKWHVGARLVPGPIAVSMVDDVRLLAAPGMPGATGAAYFGLHEFVDMAFVLHVLRPGDVFFDVGANVGSYTVLAASRGARVVSFEPLDATARKLERNVCLNGFSDRVEVVRAAVGETSGSVKFTDDQDTANHIAIDEDSVIEVATVRLDDQKLRPAVIKIDAEGFELAAVRGATAILDSSELLALVVEVNDACHKYNASEAMFIDHMAKHAFFPHAYDPLTRKLSRIDGVNKAENNTIFVRDAALLEKRTTTGPKFSLRGQTI